MKPLSKIGGLCEPGLLSSGKLAYAAIHYFSQWATDAFQQCLVLTLNRYPRRQCIVAFHAQEIADLHDRGMQFHARVIPLIRGDIDGQTYIIMRGLSLS